MFDVLWSSDENPQHIAIRTLLHEMSQYRFIKFDIISTALYTRLILDLWTIMTTAIQFVDSRIQLSKLVSDDYHDLPTLLGTGPECIIKVFKNR